MRPIAIVPLGLGLALALPVLAQSRGSGAVGFLPFVLAFLLVAAVGALFTGRKNNAGFLLPFFGGCLLIAALSIGLVTLGTRNGLVEAVNGGWAFLAVSCALLLLPGIVGAVRSYFRRDA